MLAGLEIGLRRGLRVLGASFALTVAVSACGSGEDGNTVAALPKAMFVKRANAICERGGDEIGAVYRKYAGKDFPKGFDSEEFMNKVAERIVIPVRKKELAQLRLLGAPRGDEQRVEEILTAIEEGIERGEEDRRSLRAGGSRYAFLKALNLEGKYGLSACALG